MEPHVDGGGHRDGASDAGTGAVQVQTQDRFT